MQSIGTPFLWTAFVAGIVALLALDLGVVNRRAHAIGAREAARWTIFFVSAAAAFAAWLFHAYGKRVGLEFVTGYLIEYALSVDNLFVFLVVFKYFAVPAPLRHRVLFWGILGAIVLRAAFILAGAALLTRFHWTIYLLGAFLVVTGLRLLFTGDQEVHPEHNPVLRLVRRVFPITSDYEGTKFFIHRKGRNLATPLFLVLVVVESTDIAFAVDSIPAVFGVTRDPFLCFTSNIFAILGLRALFFLLADFIDRFHHLATGLGLVLAFVGGKMIASDWYEVPIGASLGVIATLLAGSVAASLRWPRRAPDQEPER